VISEGKRKGKADTSTSASNRTHLRKQKMLHERTLAHTP